MDQVTLYKSQLRKERWKQLIMECQASDLTVAEFCAQNNIVQQTYYKNLKKLRQEICDSLPAISNQPEKPVTFSKLEVQTPVPDTQAAVIIRLPAATLEIQNGASQQTVEAVLLALKSVC